MIVWILDSVLEEKGSKGIRHTFIPLEALGSQVVVQYNGERILVRFG